MPSVGGSQEALALIELVTMLQNQLQAKQTVITILKISAHTMERMSVKQKKSIAPVTLHKVMIMMPS